MRYQHIIAYNFIRLIPGNVCAQAESILKPMKTLVLAQHHVEKILQKKENCHIKLSAPTTWRKLH